MSRFATLLTSTLALAVVAWMLAGETAASSPHAPSAAPAAAPVKVMSGGYVAAGWGRPRMVRY